MVARSDLMCGKVLPNPEVTVLQIEGCGPLTDKDNDADRIAN